MMHTTHSGLGPLASVGFALIIATEVTLRAVTQDPTITAPHSWWLMSGYSMAAMYCILLHVFLKRREARLGYDSPGSGHTLAGIAIRYWSVVYIGIGFLRVSADK